MAGVKLVTRRTSDSRRPSPAPDQAGLPEDDLRPPGREPGETAQLVAIGTSTGGPPALQAILACLPADFRTPILVVQHMSLGFIAGLARWLDETVAVRVKVAEAGELVRPATVYLAPDGHHLQVATNGRVWLQPGPTIDGHCPSVTALFRSLAATCGPATIAVLLTGMGADGAAGLLDLRCSGAWTIAQDESTSIVFGMPKEAIARGAAVEVLPLGRIGQRLLELIRRPVATTRQAPSPGGGP
jgi:two-component system chemotaxis response regulator CheB